MNNEKMLQIINSIMNNEVIDLETVGRFCEVLHIDLYNAIKII